MFIRTERLLLRPGWIEDAPALAAAISDEAILTKLALAPSPYHEDDALEFLKLPRDANSTDFLIFARTNGAPRLVGGVGLKPDDGAFELGYWIARAHWGLGIATEAARAVVDMARYSLKQRRLVSGHFIDNAASGNVLIKLGFRPTGKVVERESRARGMTVPCKLYALELDDEVAPEMTHALAA
jgi:RimJ/RimL family protein N-acetyltransferase